MADPYDRPWHVSLVGALAVLWHLLAAADYLLTKLEVGAYFALFTEPQIAYFTSMPAWVNAAWAVGTWTGVIGAFALWSGWRGAALWFAAATVGMAVAALWFAVLSSPTMQTVTGPVGLWIIAAGVAVPLLLWIYARAVHAAGAIP